MGDAVVGVGARVLPSGKVGEVVVGVGARVSPNILVGLKVGTEPSGFVGDGVTALVGVPVGLSLGDSVGEPDGERLGTGVGAVVTDTE